MSKNSLMLTKEWGVSVNLQRSGTKYPYQDKNLGISWHQIEEKISPSLIFGQMTSLI